MTLPQWNRPSQASPRLAQQWQDYIAALRQHEDGHYAIALAAAEELNKRISGLSSSAGCKALGKDVDTVASATLDEFGKKNSDYDLTTGHGRTQGAVFP